MPKEMLMSRLIDLTGKRFGRLTVLHRGNDHILPSGYHAIRWVCRCDCGKVISVYANGLQSGRAKSCGCLRSDSLKDRIEQNNLLGRHDGTMICEITSKRKLNTNNKSGVKGVYWSKKEERWIARIGLRGKSITLGRFLCKENAIAARKHAECQLYSPIIDDYFFRKH
jgi:hypothetical protein